MVKEILLNIQRGSDKKMNYFELKKDLGLLSKKYPELNFFVYEKNMSLNDFLSNFKKLK